MLLKKVPRGMLYIYFSLCEAMASDAHLVMNVVIDKCKGVFDGLESFVDIGGGTGTVAKAIADAFPDIECIVLDLPHVVAGFQGSKNLKYVGGDMFEAIPPADAVFMKITQVRVAAVKGDHDELHKQTVFVDFAKVNDEQTSCRIKDQTLSMLVAFIMYKLCLAKRICNERGYPF